jgi:RNA polymerase sigma-70 factor (ECF subfamily)
MEWVTTSTLLQRMQQFEDAGVWERFHERFRGPLAAFAQRFGLVAAERDDAVQDVLTEFVRSYREGRYSREKGRLSSWLFGIAYRQMANRRRKNARQARKEQARGGPDSFWEKAPEESIAAAAWDADWEAATLETCLRQVRGELAANTFEAFQLVVREGRTPDEAAAKLGMTRDAVYVAKHRVLKRLKELTAEYEELRPQD